MNKFIALLTTFIFYVVCVNAQHHQFMGLTLDDFSVCIFKQDTVTTEFIECSPGADIYTRIDIHRNYGVPRFGIVTSCEGQILDTVEYIPSNFNRHTEGGINSPLVTDSTITIWWQKGFFTVTFMDVLNGEIVLSITAMGQPATGFHNAINFIDCDSTSSLALTTGFSPKKSTNPGELIGYSNLSNGLYWIYITDDNNVIWYMRTIRKGI